MNMKKFECPICGEVFTLKSAFYEHITAHREADRYTDDDDENTIPDEVIDEAAVEACDIFYAFNSLIDDIENFNRKYEDYELEIKLTEDGIEIPDEIEQTFDEIWQEAYAADLCSCDEYSCDACDCCCDECDCCCDEWNDDDDEWDDDDDEWDDDDEDKNDEESLESFLKSFSDGLHSFSKNLKTPKNNTNSSTFNRIMNRFEETCKEKNVDTGVPSAKSLNILDDIISDEANKIGITSKDSKEYDKFMEKVLKEAVNEVCNTIFSI